MPSPLARSTPMYADLFPPHDTPYVPRPHPRTHQPRGDTRTVACDGRGPERRSGGRAVPLARRVQLAGCRAARRGLGGGAGGLVAGQGIVERRALHAKDPTGPRCRHTRGKRLTNRLQALGTDRPWTTRMM